MDSSASRADAMKPVILKAGIPLVISVAGLLFARFITRRENRQITSSASKSETALDCEEEEEEEETTGATEASDVQVSTMEGENKKIQNWMTIYLKVLEEIQGLRSENGLHQRKVRRLTRITKKLSTLNKQKNMKISGVERELLKSLDELETKSQVTIKMEEEIQELKNVIDRLQEERNELQSKSLGSESEIVTAWDYRRFLREYENLQRDRADEVKELIFLRWSNACLRHELMRNRGQDQEDGTQLEEFAFGGDENHKNSTDGLALEQGDDEQNGHNQDQEEEQHVCSKRKKLMKKLKRWVEGNDQKGKSKIEEKCNERHSVVSEPEEEQIALPRRFCSSV